MNYANIKPVDISNGTGVRVSLFVSGCTHRCKGCFNREAWDFNFGQEFTTDTFNQIIDLLKPDYISGLSLLGGEPLENANYWLVVSLVGAVKYLLYPHKTIWLYTGYKWEDIKHFSIFNYIDVVVDGEFKEELKDISLNFRGSSNQRIIDVKKSKSKNEVVLMEV